MFSSLIKFVRDIYRTDEFIPLHEPVFRGNEKRYVVETIDSTFVSSVGRYIGQFEQSIAGVAGVEAAVATVNGTAALHVSLYAAGVGYGDLVITQPLTFVATCNAMTQLGAKPVFVDVERESLGLCPNALSHFLEDHASIDQDGVCRHVDTGRRIAAVVPMHTFGHPVQLDELASICGKWRIELIEDAAESTGSYYKGRHTGSVGRYGVLSFNGNKIVTAGGGGAVLCQRKSDAKRIRHITTTAKVPHAYSFYHDEHAFNCRMPNINAALVCAQLEQLPSFLKAKRELASRYREFFSGSQCEFVSEPAYAKSNYWLNAVICPDLSVRDSLLEETNNDGVMTRPVWTLMTRLPMFRNAIAGDLPVAEYLGDRLVNLPSTPLPEVEHA